VLETYELGKGVGQPQSLFLRSLPLRLQFRASPLELDLQPANLVPQCLVRALKLSSKPVQPFHLFLQSLKCRSTASALLRGLAIRNVRSSSR
jgi:hypothetical protein